MLVMGKNMEVCGGGHLFKGGVLSGVTINAQKHGDHPVQGLPALSNVCVLLF